MKWLEFDHKYIWNKMDDAYKMCIELIFFENVFSEIHYHCNDGSGTAIAICIATIRTFAFKSETNLFIFFSKKNVI